MEIQELIQTISNMDLNTIALSVKNLDLDIIKSASDIFFDSAEKISIEGLWSASY